MSELTRRVRAKFPGAYDDMSDADLEKAVLAKHPEYADLASKPEPAKAAAPESSGGVLQTAKDVGIGALKGLGSTVAGLGEMAVNAGMVPGAVPAAFNADMRNPVFRKTDEATTASNTAQRVGKIGEQVAEAALPVAAGVNAIPRITRAGKALEAVKIAAKDVPMNLEQPGNVALRIQELADRGGTMPRTVSKFIQRATNPEKGPMAFGEGRDFYSNISRLSADEYNRLTPVIQREVGNLRSALGGSLEQAANTVGKGEQYANAMKEYAQAAKLQSYKDALVAALGSKTAQGIGQGLGGAAGAGAAYWLWKQLADR